MCDVNPRRVNPRRSGCFDPYRKPGIAGWRALPCASSEPVAECVCPWWHQHGVALRRPALSVHRATGEEGQAVSPALGGSAVVGTVSLSARAPAGNRSTAASSEPRRTSDMRVIGLPG